MIYGVEGRWLWIPPPYADDHTVAQYATGTTGGPANQYPLKMQRRDSTGAKVFPRYWVEKIGGLRSTGDSNDTRDGKVQQQGEIPRPSYRRGKTVTYEGIIQCTSLVQLHIWSENLKAAFDDETAEGLMICLPPGPDASGTYAYFWAKSIACEIADELAFSPNRVFTGGHERRFVAAVRSARSGGVFYRDQSGATFV